MADDCADVRWLVRMVLADDVTDTIEVSNGRDLFWTIESLLAAQSPSALVVSEVSIPVYNALDVIEAWCDVGSGIPLVLMSGFANALVDARVRRLGGVLLPKPFSSLALQAAVARAIAQKATPANP